MKAKYDDPRTERCYRDHIAEGKCREPMRVSLRWTRWCDYKAVTDAGYCLIHDPERKRERATARWKRQPLKPVG